MIDPPITVFDCGVFLQGLLSKSGPATECLELIAQNHIRLVMSEAILAEVRDVLDRPEIRRLSDLLTDEKVNGLVDLILDEAEFVHTVPSHVVFARDPKDEPYLNIAIETDADFLVTRDRDMLDLMTDTNQVAKDFRRKFRKLKIVDPIQYLVAIR